MDKLRRRQRRDHPFSRQLANGNLSELGKHLPQHRVRDLLVALGILPQTFG
jgi:hypothetical protein